MEEQMSRNVNKVMVDKEKLHAVLRGNGLNSAKVSKMIGYESGYLASRALDGWLPERAAKLIELMTGIDPEMYAPDEEAPALPETGRDVGLAAPTAPTDLEEIIYRAICRALEKERAHE